MKNQDWVRYSELKKQQRLGMFLSKEDFLFVKGIDQRSNARRQFRHVDRRRPNIGPPVYGGYNTAPR